MSQNEGQEQPKEPESEEEQCFKALQSLRNRMKKLSFPGQERLKKMLRGYLGE